MITSKTLLTFPSFETVGMFPFGVTLLIGVLVFIISFQNFFSDIKYAITQDLYFDQLILDTMITLALPCSLLCVFVMSQVRSRLGTSMKNAVFIIHSILAIISLILSLMYIAARPEQSLNFMSSMIASNEISFQNLIDWCKQICPEDSLIWKLYNVQTASGYNVMMILSSYAFPVQLFYAMSVSALVCNDYGLRKTILYTQYNAGENRFIMSTKEPSKKQLKYCEETRSDIKARQRNGECV